MALSESAALSAAECERLAALAHRIPGRQRRVAAALGGQRSAPAVDALLRLPSTLPGVVEGLFRAFRAGVRRIHTVEVPLEVPGNALGRGAASWTSPAVLALDFRSSRSRQFPALLRRARLSFGSALERLDIGAAGTNSAKNTVYRLAVWGPEIDPHVDADASLDRWRPDVPKKPPQLSTLADEFTWLHAQLGKLRGTRLWINGWCFPHTRVRAEITQAVQVHLVRAWVEWARDTVEPTPAGGGHTA